MHRITAVALLVGAFIAAGCSGAASSTTDPASSSAAPLPQYTGADGVTSDITDTSRIVTLSGDLTEIIFELGAGDAVVATDLTTVYPDDAVALPTVGVGRFLSPEAVLKHDPTLVIGDTQTSPLSAIDQIRAAGVPVIILEVSTTFDTMYSKIEDLGRILQAEESAAALEARMRDEMAAATASAAAEGLRIAYVYTRGPDVMLLFGSEMVTHPVIEATNATDAGALSGVEGSITVTPEALISAAPDVLIVPSEGLEALGGIEGLLAIPGIAQTPAGRQRWILAYPEGDFLTIGPRIPETLALLVADLAAGP